jgi:CheY-like chemotaxis protein
MAVGVLIVEDEFLLRAEAADFFEESGFTVYKASHADEAIALLELHDDIRAVFTDIHMPGSMDGLKLAHYVRGRWPLIHVKAVDIERATCSATPRRLWQVTP